MCIFDLSGTVYVNNTDVRVERVGNMLVLQFAGSIIIPFHLRRRLFGRYDLYIMDEKVLSVSGGCRAKLTFDFKLSMLGTSWDLYTGRNYIGGRAIVGSHVIVGTKVFQELTLRLWCNFNGVAPPVGCVYRQDGEIISLGCDMMERDDTFIVKFPNGLVFPILCVGECIRVCNTDVPCEDMSTASVSVNVLECCESSVRFRVSVIGHQNVVVVDNIELDRDGARYGNSFLSSHQIAKHLLLG